MGTVSGEGNNSARAPLKGLHAIFAVVNQTTLCRPILALPPTDVIISHTLSDFQIIPASPNPPSKKKKRGGGITKEMCFFYDDLGALETPGAVAGRGAGSPARVCCCPGAGAAPARPQPGLPALMSSPATWALELLCRRSPPGPIRPGSGSGSAPGPAGATGPGSSEHGRRRPHPPLPRAPATHKFEPSEGGVKASSSPSDSNPRVQETASSDSRDEPALSEVGSGEERRGNPGCSGEAMRAVQCYGCTPANA